jgi:adenylate cyclase
MQNFPLSILKRKGTQRNKRRALHASILIGTGSLFVLIIAFIQPFYTFNLWFSDQFVSSGNSSPNIVVAGIDDDTLAKFGKWSDWPRSLHAQAVNNLENAGASVIGFDIIFTDSSSADQAFTDSLQKAGNVVLAGAGTNRISVKNSAVTYKDFLLPTIDLYHASSNIGHVNIIPDPDGKVRRIPLILQKQEGDTFPSLGLATLFTLFHQTPPEKYALVDNNLNLLMREIPLDSSYSMRLNYTAAEKKPTFISYGDVINDDFEASLVKNKIVLIGMTETGDIDQFSIPNSAVRIPGVYIHAATIDTILLTQFLTDVPLDTTVILILLLIILCAIVLPLFGTWRRTDVLKGTGFLVALLVIYIVVCASLAGQGYIMNVLYPSLLLIGLYITNILFIVIQEQTDKRFVKDLFGRYVSPQISKEIVSLANNGGLKLGGEEREVTVMFADIRNFTSISEKMSPDGVVAMLNSCLPILIDAIVENKGLVNKFAGDNLMGVWNAPQPQAEYSRLAVKAALEAQRNMFKMCKNNPNLSNVQFGIGINTGKALAGNVGSLGRAEYTVIGDEVNLASRICSVTPGGEIYIGPETYSQTKQYFTVEALEPQVFKGKTKPIGIYRVTGSL